ncbi:MAG: hypothetical protein ACXVPN_10730 [Bacteroidia bacterium]
MKESLKSKFLTYKFNKKSLICQMKSGEGCKSKIKATDALKLPLKTRVSDLNTILTLKRLASYRENPASYQKMGCLQLNKGLWHA